MVIITWQEISTEYNIDNDPDQRPIATYESPDDETPDVLFFVAGSDKDGWIVVGVESLHGEFDAGSNGGTDIYATRDDAKRRCNVLMIFRQVAGTIARSLTVTLEYREGSGKVGRCVWGRLRGKVTGFDGAAAERS